MSKDEAKKEVKKEEKKEEQKLCDELYKLLTENRKRRDFDPLKWIDAKCALFNEYMSKCGLSGCVVSLSGGVDSAVTLGLMKKASLMKDSCIKKVLAVNQPIHSSDWAETRAAEAAKRFDVEFITIDQTPIYDNLKKLIDTKTKIKGNQFASGQLRSYMRTPCIYYVAQLMSQSGFPAIVMGTGNKDEDGYLAYFCKAGDGVVDVQLIADLHKYEVFEVAKRLNVPESIIKAKPSADLWDSQTDEEELGFTYDFIEFWTNFIEYDEEQQKEIRKSLSKNALKQLNEWGAKAVAVHKRNAHKLDSPVNINIVKNDEDDAKNDDDENADEASKEPKSGET